MATDLDELVTMTSAADQQAFRDLLARNPNLATRVESSQAVFKAFVDGDTSQVDAAAQAARDRATAEAARNQPVAQRAQLDLADLEKLADARAEAKFTAITTAPEYIASQEAMIERITKKVADGIAPTLLSNAARSADEIYQVRRSHEKEFGTELDTPKFTEFLNANTGKFADLSKAHDAYVQDQRIEAKIAKGVAEGVAATQSTEVPGTTLPSASSPLGSMIRANKLTVGETARGPAIDNAVRAFRALQASRAD